MNDMFRSLSGFREAELVLIQSPPLPIRNRPQEDIASGSASLMTVLDMPWVRTSEKYVAICLRRASSGKKDRLCGLRK